MSMNGPEITKRMLDEQNAVWTFDKVKAFLDVIRYEETDRAFKEVHALQKQVLSDGDGEPYPHRWDDRDMTHDEVYRRALEDVMDLLDIRMGVLSR